MTVLFDSNVWVSSLLNPKGYPAKLKKLWLKDKFSVIVSTFIINEIRDTLNRPRIKNKYHLTNSEIAVFLELLILRCPPVFPVGKIKLCRDIRDNHILEAASLGKAEYIITRDDDLKRDIHLMETMKSFNIEILSVSQFINII